MVTLERQTAENLDELAAQIRGVEIDGTRVLEGLPALDHLEEVAQVFRGDFGIIVGKTGSGKSLTSALVAEAMHRSGEIEGQVFTVQHNYAPSRTQFDMLTRIVSQDDANPRFGMKVAKTRGVNTSGTEAQVTIGTTTHFFHRMLSLREGEGGVELDGVGAVIIDEAHEETTSQFELEALLKEANDVRKAQGKPLIKIIYCSATLSDSLRTSIHDFWDIDEDSDRYNQVDMGERRWNLDRQCLTQEQLDKLPSKFEDRITSVIEQEILSDKDETSDVLVFVDGKSTIKSVKEDLESKYGDQYEILDYHGEQTTEEQDRVLKPHNLGDEGRRRRIVLTTPALQSGQTIPGIGVVLVSGKAKIKWFNPVTNREELVLADISQETILQMAGRGARDQDGRFIFMGTEEDFQRRAGRSFYTYRRREYQIESAEIVNQDPSDLILRLAGWRLPIERVQLRRRPSESAISKGNQELARLGAITDNGELTEGIGERMHNINIHPRYGRSIVEASNRAETGEANVTREVIDISAIASSGELLRRSAGWGVSDRVDDYMKRYEVPSYIVDKGDDAVRAEKVRERNRVTNKYVQEAHDKLKADVRSSVIDARGFDAEVDDIDMYNYIAKKVRTLAPSMRSDHPKRSQLELAISQVVNEYNLVFNTVARGLKEADNIHRYSGRHLNINSETDELAMTAEQKKESKRAFLRGNVGRVYRKVGVTGGRKSLSQYIPILGEVDEEVDTMNISNISMIYNPDNAGRDPEYIVTDNITSIPNGDDRVSVYSGMTFGVSIQELGEFGEIFHQPRPTGSIQYDPEVDFIMGDQAEFLGNTDHQIRSIEGKLEVIGKSNEALEHFVDDVLMDEGILERILEVNNTDNMLLDSEEFERLMDALRNNLEIIERVRALAVKIEGYNEFEDINLVENPQEYIRNYYRSVLESDDISALTIYDLIKHVDKFVLKEAEFGLPDDTRIKEIEDSFPSSFEFEYGDGETMTIQLEYGEVEIEGNKEKGKIAVLTLEQLRQLKDVELSDKFEAKYLRISTEGIDQRYLEIGETRKRLENRGVKIVPSGDVSEGSIERGTTFGDGFNTIRDAMISSNSRYKSREIPLIPKYDILLPWMGGQMVRSVKAVSLGTSSQYITSFYDSSLPIVQPRYNGESVEDEYYMRILRSSSALDGYGNVLPHTIDMVSQRMRELELQIEFIQDNHLEYTYGSNDIRSLIIEMEEVRNNLSRDVHSEGDLVRVLVYMSTIEYSITLATSNLEDDDYGLIPQSDPTQELDYGSYTEIVKDKSDLIQKGYTLFKIAEEDNEISLQPTQVIVARGFIQTFVVGEPSKAQLKHLKSIVESMEDDPRYSTKLHAELIELRGGEAQKRHERYTFVRNFFGYSIKYKSHAEKKENIEKIFGQQDVQGVPNWIKRMGDNDYDDGSMLEQFEGYMRSCLANRKSTDEQYQAALDFAVEYYEQTGAILFDLTIYYQRTKLQEEIKKLSGQLGELVPAEGDELVDSHTALYLEAEDYPQLTTESDLESIVKKISELKSAIKYREDKAA